MTAAGTSKVYELHSLFNRAVTKTDALDKVVYTHDDG
jgi:hypothetical protein